MKCYAPPTRHQATCSRRRSPRRCHIEPALPRMRARRLRAYQPSTLVSHGSHKRSMQLVKKFVQESVQLVDFAVVVASPPGAGRVAFLQARLAWTLRPLCVPRPRPPAIGSTYSFRQSFLLVCFQLYLQRRCTLVSRLPPCATRFGLLRHLLRIFVARLAVRMDLLPAAQFLPPELSHAGLTRPARRKGGTHEKVVEIPVSTSFANAREAAASG